MPNKAKKPQNIKLTEAWKRFILYCQLVCQHGEVRIEIKAGEPRQLLEAKRDIRFDKEETVDFILAQAEKALSKKNGDS